MAPSALNLDRYTCQRPGTSFGFSAGYNYGLVSFSIGTAELLYNDLKIVLPEANLVVEKGVIKLGLYNRIWELGLRKIGL